MQKAIGEDVPSRRGARGHARAVGGRFHVLALSVLAVSLVVPSCGGGGSTSSAETVSANPKLAAARKAFCADLVAVGGGAEIRPEAIARLLPHLHHDAALYRRAGDKTDAFRVSRFAAALARVRAAALGNGDTTKANQAVQRASAHLPSCIP